MAKKLLRRVKAKASVPSKSSGLDLPTERKEPDHNLLHYTILLYGREKIGKTTLISTFPDVLFFSTEPGTKGLSIYEYNADNGGVCNWDVFRTGVDKLVANPGKFKMVAIDTVDRAYEMALDWVCENRGIEYPGTDSDGKEDFGKSWKAVKVEFTEQIHRILQSGRGVIFTSHAKESEIKTRSGDKYMRIYPTMSGQARSVVEALVDMFFYCEYVNVGGEVKRVLICQGDDAVWAGARPTVTKSFPQFLPMDAERGYEIIKAAFLGKEKGLNAKDLFPNRKTSQAAGTLVKKASAKAR